MLAARSSAYKVMHSRAHTRSLSATPHTRRTQLPPDGVATRRPSGTVRPDSYTNVRSNARPHRHCAQHSRDAIQSQISIKLNWIFFDSQKLYELTATQLTLHTQNVCTRVSDGLDFKLIFSSFARSLRVLPRCLAGPRDGYKPK